MNYDLIKHELKMSYKSWTNIHMNELHSPCESGICDMQCQQ
jgi:hypothetical protein